MGCKVCKSYTEGQNTEVIVDENKFFELSDEKKIWQSAFTTETKEVPIENVFIDLGVEEDNIVFSTKKNDIKKFKKEEISERSTQISKEFVLKTNKAKSSVNFDLVKFQKEILRSIEKETWKATS